MCVVVGFGSRSHTVKGIGMFRIPSMIKNQGEEREELATLTREKCISNGDQSRRYDAQKGIAK